MPLFLWLTVSALSVAVPTVTQLHGTELLGCCCALPGVEESTVPPSRGWPQEGQMLWRLG